MYSLFSFILGALLTTAFAPLNWWPISYISLIGIAWLWLQPKYNRPIRYGFFFGLGNFATGVYWVYISLHYYGGASWFFAIFANILLICYLALYPMAVGASLTLLRTRPATIYRALLIALIWMAGEWLRSYVLTGFPWLSIGYSQLYGIFKGIAPLAGQFGVGLILMICCALIAYTLCTRKIWPAICAAVIVAGSLATGKLQFTSDIGKPLSVALIQGNIPPLTRWDPEIAQANMDRYISLTSQQNAEVVIWPENAMPYMASQIEETILDPLNAHYLLEDQAVVMGLLTGSFEKDEYFNSVKVLGNGSGEYSKIHLLPFGEFLPLKSVFAFFKNYVDIPMSGFSRGAEYQKPVITHGVPAGVSICFEAAFGRVIRRALPEAQYLINVSNDSWFKQSWASDQHIEMDQMRSLELGREMARSANTGITAFISADGILKKTLPRDKIGVLTGQIQPRIGLTPYAKYGNTIFGSILLLYAIILGLIYPFRNKHARAISSPTHRT